MEKKGLKKAFKIISIVAQVILIVICSFLLIRNICYDAVVVHHSSMYPTLKEGDYGYAINTRYALNNIKRFDIIVFHQDINNEDTKLIKRVIGLPGENIEFKGEDYDLYVNDKLVKQDFFDIKYQRQTKFSLTETKFTIPEDKYFVLGDNRAISLDSRNFGYVNKENIFGILKVITAHIDDVSEEKMGNKTYIPFRFY